MLRKKTSSTSILALATLDVRSLSPAATAWLTAEPSFAPDEIRFDEKGEKGEKGDVDQAFFSDEQIAEMWLRGVERTPADFLRMKFAFQAYETERRQP